MEVPDKSVLIVRAGGAGMRGLTIQVPGEDGTQQRMEAPAPANRGDVLELKYDVRRSGTITVHSSGMQVASWTFTVIPDHAPKISMTKEPERSPRGSLKLFYKAEDDYGIVSRGSPHPPLDAESRHLVDRMGARAEKRRAAALRASSRAHAQIAARLCEDGRGT